MVILFLKVCTLTGTVIRDELHGYQWECSQNNNPCTISQTNPQTNSQTISQTNP